MSVFQIRRVVVPREEAPTAVGYTIEGISTRIVLLKKPVFRHLIAELPNIAATITSVLGDIGRRECKLVLFQQNQDGLFSRTHDIAILGGRSQSLKCVRYLIDSIRSIISRYSEISITTKWDACTCYSNDCFRVHWVSENERAGVTAPTRKWSYPTTMITKGRQGENSSPSADCIAHQVNDDFVLTSAESAGAWISTRDTIDLEAAE